MSGSTTTGEERTRRVTSRRAGRGSRWAASVLLLLAGCGAPEAAHPTAAQRAAMVSAGRAVGAAIEGSPPAGWSEGIPAGDLVALRDLGSPSLALHIDLAMASLAAARGEAKLAAIQGRVDDKASALKETIRLALDLQRALDKGKVEEVVAICRAMPARPAGGDGR